MLQKEYKKQISLTGNPDTDAKYDESEDEEYDGPGPGKLGAHAGHLPANIGNHNGEQQRQSIFTN